MKKLLLLAVLTGAMPDLSLAQAIAYPTAKVVAEFDRTCSGVSDVTDLQKRAKQRGWQQVSPAVESDVGKMIAEMRSESGDLLIRQTYDLLFVLRHVVADRVLWLVISDMHVPDSDRLQSQRSCAIFDEGAPEISEAAVSQIVGGEPNVNRTQFGFQYYWDPAVTKDASYTAVVYCNSFCPDVVGLKFEASLMDWKDGQHAW